MEEQLSSFLKSRQIPDPFAAYKEALLQAGNGAGFLDKLFRGKSTASLLNKENAQLGLLLINQHPDVKDAESSWSNIRSVVFNGERYNRIKQLTEDDWNSEGNFNLLRFLFGEEKARYVRHAWQQMRYQMYQKGYTRRSFRSTENRHVYFQRQIDFIVTILCQSFTQSYSLGERFTYYDLTVLEQIKYNHAVGDHNAELFRLWSAAIDLQADGVLQLLEDIIYSKDADGKVTKSIIKAHLNSENKEAWIIVEKLLLAAQRQEGLRQSILESLDETSIGALRYFLRVIIDQNLVRFSSVVRAIDVWAGFGWESERESTVRSFLEKASLYLENPASIPEAIGSANNADVYMALWAQGVYDVEKTIPYLQKLYRQGDVQKRALAIYFASQAWHYRIGMPLFYEALKDTELQPLALAIEEIRQLAALGGNAPIYNKDYPDMFERLRQLYERITVKEKTFESFVFSWMTVRFERKSIVQAMFPLVDKDFDRLETLVGYFEDMDAELKRKLSAKVLPQISPYTAVNKMEPTTEPLTAFQRKYALIILKDRSEYEMGYKALKKEHFSPDELSAFPEWLKRKGAEFRDISLASY